MTLKDKVQQVNPECADENYKGGVCGCPDDYNYLHCDRDELFDKCNAITTCEECWNQPYIEPTRPEWQENIMNKFMQVI